MCKLHVMLMILYDPRTFWAVEALKSVISSRNKPFLSWGWESVNFLSSSYFCVIKWWVASFFSVIFSCWAFEGLKAFRRAGWKKASLVLCDPHCILGLLLAHYCEVFWKLLLCRCFPKNLLIEVLDLQQAELYSCSQKLTKRIRKKRWPWKKFQVLYTAFNAAVWIFWLNLLFGFVPTIVSAGQPT